MPSILAMAFCARSAAEDKQYQQRSQRRGKTEAQNRAHNEGGWRLYDHFWITATATPHQHDPRIKPGTPAAARANTTMKRNSVARVCHGIAMSQLERPRHGPYVQVFSSTAFSFFTSLLVQSCYCYTLVQEWQLITRRFSVLRGSSKWKTCVTRWTNLTWNTVLMSYISTGSFSLFFGICAENWAFWLFMAVHTA